MDVPFEDVLLIALNGAFLLILSIQDLKHRTISLIPVILLGIVNAGLCVATGRGLKDVILGVIPGVFAIMLSLGTRGKLGLGDGLVLLVSGLVFDWNRVLSVWLLALVLSALFGLVLILMKKASIKTALPFVPFLFTGFAALEIAERVKI